MATECYKCMNGLNPTYLQDIVTTINTEYTRINPKLEQQPKYKIVTHGINTYRYILIKVKKYEIVYLEISKTVLP